MYCAKCGNILREKSKFCAKCGNEVSKRTTDDYEIDVTSEIINVENNQLALFVTAIVIISALIIIVLISFSTSKII